MANNEHERLHTSLDTAPRAPRRGTAVAVVALAALVAGLLLGCASQPVTHPVYVFMAPPPEPAEIGGAAPSPSYVWVKGYYAWNGVEYVWIPGAWQAKPRARAVWIAGRWQRTRRGWTWVDGHWK